MGCRTEKGNINEDRGDIFLGCHCGDGLLWMFVWKESLYGVSKGNSKIMGGNK